MTKKGNTIIFLIAATGFNILLTVMIFVGLFFLFFIFIRPLISDNGIVFALPVIFVIAIFISFAVYRALLKRFLANFDMDKYFDTAFSLKKRLPPPKEPE
jgi:hypothetical protein